MVVDHVTGQVMHEGPPAADVLPGRMFSFERHDAGDRGADDAALRSVRRNTSNTEGRIEYFLAVRQRSTNAWPRRSRT